MSVGGRVASLLELGMGFQPEFSGRENIVFNGRFLGLKDHEIRDRMADITLPDLDGKPVSLRSLEGKKYILFMWASW